MFSLISGFYTQFFQKPTYKILIFGIDNAGKTVILFISILIDNFGVNKVNAWPEIHAFAEDNTYSWIKHS